MSSRKLQVISPSVSATFRRQLLAWYDAHARDLPWRAKPGSTEPGSTKLKATRHGDPYRVWLSEIMLQQTRVAAVIAHYREFLRRFPTVEKLARSRESSVLAAWSGLGYYRRARMLHATARVVVRELNGEFPSTSDALRELPGVGRYTAAAIASIAFDDPVAVVDGNVERVLQRVSGRCLAGEDFWLAAEALLDRERPGDFNQAMMELGATVCTPRAPSCLACPVVELCVTRGEIAGAAKASPQKKREIHCALNLHEGKVFLVQRPLDASLMASMWELPEIAPLRSRSKPALTLRHSITVTDYTVHVWRDRGYDSIEGKWITVRRLPELAMTGLARKILRKAEILTLRNQRTLARFV